MPKVKPSASNINAVPRARREAKPPQDEIDQELAELLEPIFAEIDRNLESIDRHLANA